MTRIVNLRKERYDIYIGRGSKWGNPFKIGIDGTREEVIEKYRKHFIVTGLWVDINKLKDKVLGCYCKPLACHGDILVEMIEKYVDKED